MCEYSRIFTNFFLYIHFSFLPLLQLLLFYYYNTFKIIQDIKVFEIISNSKIFKKYHFKYYIIHEKFLSDSF